MRVRSSASDEDGSVNEWLGRAGWGQGRDIGRRAGRVQRGGRVYAKSMKPRERERANAGFESDECVRVEQRIGTNVWCERGLCLERKSGAVEVIFKYVIANT